MWISLGRHNGERKEQEVSREPVFRKPSQVHTCISYGPVCEMRRPRHSPPVSVFLLNTCIFTMTGAEHLRFRHSATIRDDGSFFSLTQKFTKKNTCKRTLKSRFSLKLKNEFATKLIC